MGANSFYYPLKYKIGNFIDPHSERTMMFRLSEMYLIRAEARAETDDLTNASSDLNIVRNRAGLDSIFPNTKNDCIQAILNERRVEFFSEEGHRWFDLKRLNAVDSVMSIYAPLKGGKWSSNQRLFPIPQKERDRDPFLSQNIGY